ncbi:SusC/RagA family TonB-linked outer membrane protein [Gelidibacter salicanalis]|uniref:TonB-dependent receptor n=1 Tax=Gelidibacter salicanalis TaxID=291193 RepID=A0A934NHR4_9FLAO|nr:TonB-dependent receptor [Gelidibacter salicanalis]MBJ7880123.1 TonB-dependent receptor [Gelidibacter salicanalis]
MKSILRIRNLKQCGITALMLISFSLIQAQSLGISGNVTADGKPIPGVNIIVKGTNNGTITNFDGNYQINAKTNDVLLFSYIGFKTKEITVGNNTTINLVLEIDSSELDEVVVVGYGTQRKIEVTGAVNNVKAEDIIRTAVSDIGTALQGQVAGVNIQASSGRPGEAANVQIRGLGSVNSSALGPLYVVDGVPLGNSDPGIAPEQIESIDILKDGASASIYGVRGANGVILIKTKRGTAGKLTIDLTTYTGIQNITSGTPLMNTLQQMYAEEVKLEALGLAPLIFFFNPNALDYNSDFVAEVQNDNAITQNYNLQLSGGNEDLTLSFNTNYFDQKGVLINSGFNRLSNRLTGEFKKGKFKAFATIGFTKENREEEPWSLYEYAIGQRPWQPGLDQLQSVGDNGVIIPVRNEILYSYLSQQLKNIDEREVNSTNIAFNVEYELLEGLKYKISLGRNIWNYQRKFFRPQYLVYGIDGTLKPTASREQALLNEDFIWSERNSIENIATYNKSYGAHSFDLTGVLAYESLDNKTLGTGVIFSEDATNDLQNLSSGAEALTPVGVDNRSTLAGKMLRLQYNYDDRYLLSGRIRRDGSSKFSDSNKYGTFLGFSAGWNISEEKFFENLNLQSLNNLKIRASWAELGNDQIRDYAYQSVIESGINYPFGPNEELGFGYVQKRFYDKNIKWETTISKNIGIDIAMFKNKLNFTADIYSNDKKDFLLEERLAPSTGTSQPRASGVYDVKVINAGNMINKGMEFALSYKNITEKGLNYQLSATFTKNKNKVTDLNGIQRGYANGRPVLSQGENIDYTTYLAVGHEAGAFFLVKNAGVIKDVAELAEYRTIDASAQLGDMRYIDQNGDNKIDDNDRVYSGSGQSEFEAGFNLNLEYKNFDFFAQTYYAHGAKIYNGAKLYAYQIGRHTDQFYMWTPQNSDSNIPTDRENAFHNNVRARSDYFLEDGTYLRIRNLTVGYTINNSKESVGIEKVRIYLSSVNPFTFTKYEGYDPEVGGDGLFTRGVDRGNYPVTRQFFIGFQLSF